MNSHLSFISITLLLIAGVTRVQDVPAEKHRETEFEGLKITMSLEKRSTPVEKADWPDEPVGLNAQSVLVNGKTIHELLREAHIFPDVEAFAVVYILNPEVSELRQLKVSNIRIPKVVGGTKLDAAFTRGFLVFLTVDKEKKAQFNDSVQKLRKLAQDVAKFGPNQFQDASARDAVLDSLNSTTTILGGINQRIAQRFGRPITTEVLSQLNAETESLDRLLTSKVASKSRIDKSDQDKILAIQKDVRLKGRAFAEVAAGEAPDRYPEVKVIVKTLRDGNPVPNLRIYYVPEALKNEDSEAHPFGVLTYPPHKELPEADYCFWAAKDPDRTPITNQLCLEIRRNQFEVQLTVIN